MLFTSSSKVLFFKCHVLGHLISSVHKQVSSTIYHHLWVREWPWSSGHNLPIWNGASLVAETVKCLPAMWETQVRSLGGEDPLEKEMANPLHSNFIWNLFLWTLLSSKLKSRDITLPTKVHLVKAMVFLVVMYECESWTVKKSDCWRIGAFELYCWRRLLRVPWTARRSNQSILKEINPGCSLEGMMLKLKLQYLATSCKELTHWKRLWGWEGFGAGREGDDRGWDGWMASPTRWMWVWVNSGSWWWTGKPGVLRFMGSQRVGHDWATELNWTEAPNIIWDLLIWNL